MKPLSEDVTELPAGRELDALVAEQVFGWDLSPRKAHEWGPERDAGDHHTAKLCSWCERLEYTCGCPVDPEEPCTKYVPWYSTHLEAAWRVVEAMAERGFGLALATTPMGYRVEFRTGDGESAATGALAICRAALKAVGQ